MISASEMLEDRMATENRGIMQTETEKKTKLEIGTYDVP